MKISKRSCSLSLVFLLSALVGLPAMTRAEDRLSAGGYDFTGTLKSISGGKASFEIGTTESTIEINLDSIDALSTSEPRRILFGDDGVVDGRIVGTGEGTLTVSEESGGVVSVPDDEILSASSAADTSFERWRNDSLRYWSANIDLSASVSQATVDTNQFLFALGAKRETKDSELSMSASYRYGTTTERDSDRQTNLDIAQGAINARHTVRDGFFVFGDLTATYDAIQLLSIRTLPVIGIGYDILKLDSGKLSTKFGYSWVYQRYFGGEDDEYSALAFGLTTNWNLPFDSTFEGSIDYTPDVTDFGNNYLLSASATYSVPVVSFLSFQLQIKDEYNDSPPPDATRNSLFVNVGLSLKL